MMIRNLFTKKYSISSKFTTMAIFLIILTSLIIAAFTVLNTIVHSREEILEHGTSTASILAQNSEYGIYTENEESLHEIIKSVESDPDISYIAIYDNDDRVLARRIKKSTESNPRINTESFGNITSATNSPAIKRAMKKGFIEILVPVLNTSTLIQDDVYFDQEPHAQGEVIGYLQMGLSMKRVNNKVRKYIISTSVFVLILIGLGSITTVIFANRIVSPLRILRTATQNVSAGNFNQIIEVHTNDEIQDLAADFRNMTESLQKYQDNVTSHAWEMYSANEKLLKEISRRRETEASLLITKERLQHLLNNTPAVIYSAKPDIHFSITFISHNSLKMFGFSPREIQQNSLSWLQRIHDDDVKEVKEAMKQIVKGGEREIEYRFRRKDGSYIWLFNELKILRDAEGNPREIVGYMIDISERKKLELQLKYDALHDTLTGLPNRALFMDRVNYFISHRKRIKNYDFAVFFIDVDRFKNVNDSMGHLVGDKLLKEIGLRLQKSIHPDDTVSRFGGDEFGIILNDIQSIQDVDNVLERIHGTLKHPFQIEEQELIVTVSIGIALGSHNYEAAEQILRDSDTAMYQAKIKGGNCHVFFDQEMHERAVALFQLEADLRFALDHQEFFLCYQPIVTAQTEELAGFEALIRWQHPRKGLIPPADFIPIAEETGQIVHIGEWVLREACRQLNLWEGMYSSLEQLTVSVNISSRQFRPPLVDLVEEILLQTGLKGFRLKLEITESLLMKNPDAISALLIELKKMNVQIQIDDFGTGYSSMNYLHLFPIDALKIDRSFINLMTADTEKLEVVKAIVALAHNLNMKVVAEGVESVDQQILLEMLKCEYMQGYLFSKPLERKAAGDFIRRKKGTAIT